MAKHPASKNIPKDTNAGDLLLQGSILAIAGILVRFIGLLYKVPGSWGRKVWAITILPMRSTISG